MTGHNRMRLHKRLLLQGEGEPTIQLPRSVLVLLGLSLVAASGCRYPATRGNTARLAQFEETDVFVGGHDAINTYRIPAVVCTKRGTLLVFAEGRQDSSEDGTPTHIVLKRSLGNAGPWKPLQQRGPVPAPRARGHNTTWEPMQVVIPSTDRIAYMNPVVVVDGASSAIFLLVNRYQQPYQDVATQVLLTRSDDDGATWSTPADITGQTGLKELGPGIGIQMRSGRLVVPTYDGVIFSDDHGTSWRSGGALPGILTETQVVELVSGRLLLTCRKAPYRLQVISSDGGQTWGDPWSDRTLVEPQRFGGCQASLVRYSSQKDGASKDRLLFANPADPKDRVNLTVRVSYDEGRTWPVSRRIKNGTGAYSGMTVFPDGTIGLLYETGNSYGDISEVYSKIAFARFNLEWLTGGSDTTEPAQDRFASR